MFDFGEKDRDENVPKQKNIYFIQNGFPDTLFTHSFKKAISKE
jgi:hypothetical protein